MGSQHADRNHSRPRIVVMVTEGMVEAFAVGDVAAMPASFRRTTPEQAMRRRAAAEQFERCSELYPALGAEAVRMAPTRQL